MEQDLLSAALTNLAERLSSFDQHIGSYRGHNSTSKGITLKTQSGDLFLHPFFVYRLLHSPEAITESELKSFVLNVRYRKAV